MALAILDGNQAATNLSTILSGGQHITAHTVVSLGSQSITDITSAVSGISVSVGSALPAGTNRIGVVTIGAGTVTIGAGTAQIGSVTASISGTVPVSGTFYQATQPVSLASLPSLVAGTAQIGSVTASISGTVPVSISSVTIGNSITISSLPSLVAGTAQIGSVTASISGTVTAMAGTNFRTAVYDGIYDYLFNDNFPVNIISQLPAGTNRIGSVTASISGTVTVGQIQGYQHATAATYGPNSADVTIVGDDIDAGKAGALVVIPAARGGNVLGGRTSQGDTPICVYGDNGSAVTISGTVTANTFAVQGTAVTTSNFTSTTASTVLASFNAGREVLTIFNEGAGNLHICAGATCTTIGYQVRLAAGDYYEVPNHQTTITHSAVFATTGTARVTQVS